MGKVWRVIGSVLMLMWGETVALLGIMYTGEGHVWPYYALASILVFYALWLAVCFWKDFPIDRKWLLILLVTSQVAVMLMNISVVYPTLTM